MKLLLTVCFLLLGVAHCQLGVDSVETIDDSILKEKCDSRGGKGTYEKVTTARDALQTCIEGLVDIDTLKKEIDESKKTGSMDEVFGKYCKKRPQLKTCLDNFLDKMKQCLVEDEKKNLNTVLDLLKELGEFACYKDGDRIAMFVAEQGPECIKAHVEGIKTCVNNTLKISSSSSIDSLPSFLNATKVCDDMAQIQPCIVAELEKCDNTTPANVVDSVFRFIRKRACKKTNKQRRSINRALLTSRIHLKNLINAHVEYTKLKCIVKGAKELNEFETSVNKTQKCVADYIRGNLLVLVSPMDLNQKLIECSEEFIKASENCLSENEKYYPRFSQDLMSGLVRVMSKFQENITTSSWNVEAKSCFENFKNLKNRQSILKCFEEESPNTEGEYTKTYVCSFLSEASKCVTKVISSLCVQDVAVDQFKQGFEEVFTKPCEGINDQQVNFM